MAFPPMPVFERNDPFGPKSHNNLLQRQDYLRDSLAIEHDAVTGEHNTPHVARSLGAVLWNGAAYVLDGTNGDVSLAAGNNPAVGSVILTLASDRYRAYDGVLEIQTAAEAGGSRPSIATAKFVDDTHVNVYLKQSDAFAQQNFAATDMNFFIGIRSPAIPNTADSTAFPYRRSRGDGLISDSTNWNPMIQRMGNNRSATLVGHTSSGLHDTREIAKAWGYLRYDSSSGGYSVAAHQGLGGGVARLAAGVVRVYVTNASPAIAAPVQAFARPVVTMPTPTGHAGLRTTVVPSASCTATYVDVYIYESYIDVIAGITIYAWQPADCDVFVRVHGA
jgi:hypothetical protein